MKRLLLLLVASSLASCGLPTVSSSIDQGKPKLDNRLDKTRQKDLAIRYLCKQDKEVKVVRVMSSSKSRKKVKKDEINLTFEGITGKLNSTLSQTGKAYTNIHWQWFEKAESKVLLNSVGQILAEDCIEQGNQ